MENNINNIEAYLRIDESFQNLIQDRIINC